MDTFTTLLSGLPDDDLAEIRQRGCRYAGRLADSTNPADHAMSAVMAHIAATAATVLVSRA
jgi:hypothetical protein